MRNSGSRPLTFLGLIALAATLLLVAAGGHGQLAATSPSAAWDGLVGGPRPQVALGQRMLVVLKTPSLADRVAAAGGRASDAQERRWTATAIAAQKLVISRLGLQGVQVEPEFSYSRVINGFSAPLDPRSVALVERTEDVAGVYPVRPAFPAAIAQRELQRMTFAPGLGRRPDVSLPGFDGRGVTIALLDTGIDAAQPYLRGRIREGVDILGGDPNSTIALAAANPDDPAELERHGTQLAGILVGAGGPSGLAGVATGAAILPIRIAGWQLDAAGRFAVYSRTDLIIAGLERAVDPNGDGDAHDAARIALVGVVEPYAAFSDGPTALAAAGAMRLDTLVVAPAGNNREAGPGYGNIAGPGGAPAVLTVGAADLRQANERVRVVLRAGLNVLYDKTVPLAGAVGPVQPLNLAVSSPRMSPNVSVDEQAASLAITDFFDSRGFSRVAGRAALIPAGGDVPRLVRDGARAGAALIVLYGKELPAGALGLDERVSVPVVSVSAESARALLEAARTGASAGISIGTARLDDNDDVGEIAPFSSRGLAFDGRVKPELVAAGITIATSEPGSGYGTVNGSSAAAAIVAGAAALLAHARPSLDAAALKSLLVGSARPLADTSVTAQGAGLVDVGAAAASELAADQPTLALGRATVPGFLAVRRVTVRNLSPRTVTMRIGLERQGFPAADTIVVVEPKRLTLAGGSSARIRVEARVVAPAKGGPPAEGAVVLTPVAGTPLRIPWALAFGPRKEKLLGEVRLSANAFKASDTSPAVLEVAAGTVRTTAGSAEIHAVGLLDIELFTADSHRIGLIARQRDLLPGRYTFGITGRDAEGVRLEPGVYRLRLVAYPTGGGEATRRQLVFRIKSP